MIGVFADGKAGQFPAALAAEMRSPLTVILNAAHMLSVSRDDVTVERVRRIISRQVERLADLADEIDDVPSAERGDTG